jgi:hypothetical protein
MSTGSKAIAEQLLQDAEECLDRRDLGIAARGFDAAEWMGADGDRCAAGRWMAAMLQGDFGRAWRESDAIRRRGAPDPHRLWSGDEICGKRVIVRCLHGFGDAVQFLRYASALRARAAEVIYEVAPRFMELARCFDSVNRVITWGKDAPERLPEWDVQMEVMELPYFFRTEMRDLPVAERYLRIPEQARTIAARAMGQSDRIRVGLVWSAGVWNLSRCVPFRVLAPILKSEEFEFWNLQGEGESVEPPAGDRGLLREVSGCRNNLLTLAAVISQLDLVITVDTLAAHLAGALGIPAWVMLQYAADWRWMTGTSESPWYKSLRLFRQPRPGDWLSVVGEIRASLPAWSSKSGAGLLAS